MMRKENSTNYINRSYLIDECVLSKALEKITGRWKIQILFLIHFKENRFSQLKHRLPQISDRMLGLRLHDLLEAKLILKRGSGTLTTYELSAKAQKLLPILEAITDWERGL